MNIDDILDDLKNQDEQQKNKNTLQDNSNHDNAEQDNLNETDKYEQEYKKIKIKQETFDLKIENKIKNMPDYQEEAPRILSGASTFAKIMLALIIVGASVLLSTVLIFSAREAFAVGKDSVLIVVDIPEKSGVSGIAELLEERNVISNSLIFKVYYKLFASDVALNFGTFELNQNMSYDEIIGQMSQYSAAENEVSVSFPEGMTIYEIAKKLEKNNVCKASEFIETLNTKSFGYDFEKSVTSNSLKFHKMEGFVFPETYRFFENDKPFNVANKFVNQFNIEIDDEMKASMAKMGYTLEQTITIASIVQKEAGKTEEMRKVASVYHNRLNNKDIYPNLQACPTRDYANQLKTQMDVIDQNIIDAYNTYEDKGLPPGPICNPGIDAIKATLDPESTNYFYFCTNLKSGEFFYAETLKEHEKNIKKAGLV